MPHLLLKVLPAKRRGPREADDVVDDVVDGVTGEPPERT
jgi:hypothetical protein